MNQPDFGKKIQEARTFRGMTQKELADIGGIDIRTIQRIETGNVIPRMYTVKILCRVLDLTFDEISDSNNSRQKDNIALSLAFIFGVIFIVNNIPQILVQGRLSTASYNQTLLILWIGLSVIHIASAIFFFKGWYHIGVIHQLTLLKISSVLIFILVPLYILSFALANYANFPYAGLLMSGCSILAGISALIFGIGLLRLIVRGKILSEIAGIFQLICGLMFLLPFDLSHFIGLCLTIPANILLLILVYREKSNVY